LQIREKIDSECRRLTSDSQRIKFADQSDDLCSFYEVFKKEEEKLTFVEGVYNIDDVKELGRKRSLCPYFLARKLIH